MAAIVDGDSRREGELAPMPGAPWGAAAQGLLVEWAGGRWGRRHAVSFKVGGSVIALGSYGWLALIADCALCGAVYASVYSDKSFGVAAMAGTWGLWGLGRSTAIAAGEAWKTGKDARAGGARWGALAQMAQSFVVGVRTSLPTGFEIGRAVYGLCTMPLAAVFGKLYMKAKPASRSELAWRAILDAMETGEEFLDKKAREGQEWKDGLALAKAKLAGEAGLTQRAYEAMAWASLWASAEAAQYALRERRLKWMDHVELDAEHREIYRVVGERQAGRLTRAEAKPWMAMAAESKVASFAPMAGMPTLADLCSRVEAFFEDQGEMDESSRRLCDALMARQEGEMIDKAIAGSAMQGSRVSSGGARRL